MDYEEKSGGKRKRMSDKGTEEKKRVTTGRSTTVSSLRLTLCVLYGQQSVINTVTIQPFNLLFA